MSQSRSALLHVVERLTQEYEGVVTAGTVMRCVAGCLDDLQGSGLDGGLPEAVERLARVRLEQSAGVYA